MNYVELTDQAVESMRDRDPDEPVAMINLLLVDVADPNLGLEMTSGCALVPVLATTSQEYHP